MKMSTVLAGILLAGILLTSRTSFAQPSSEPIGATPNDPNVKAIMAYYTAFEKKDWNMIQGVLADGFTFSSPLDDHISVANFKERCWPNCNNIKSFNVDKFVINGDNAFVITNGYTNNGKLFRNCDCFKLKDGKIVAYECFFGPGVNYPNSGK
jgi:hypothetical protein